MYGVLWIVFYQAISSWGLFGTNLWGWPCDTSSWPLASRGFYFLGRPCSPGLSMLTLMVCHWIGGVCAGFFLLLSGQIKTPLATRHLIVPDCWLHTGWTALQLLLVLYMRGFLASPRALCLCSNECMSVESGVTRNLTVFNDNGI